MAADTELVRTLCDYLPGDCFGEDFRAEQLTPTMNMLRELHAADSRRIDLLEVALHDGLPVSVLRARGNQKVLDRLAEDFARKRHITLTAAVWITGIWHRALAARRRQEVRLRDQALAKTVSLLVAIVLCCLAVVYRLKIVHCR